MNKLPDFLANLTRKPRHERTPNGASVDGLAAQVISNTGTHSAGMGDAAPQQQPDAPTSRPRFAAPPQGQAPPDPQQPDPPDDPGMTAFQPSPRDESQPWQELISGQQSIAPAAASKPAATDAPPAAPTNAPARHPWQTVLADHHKKLAALEADENPKDKNGRVMSIVQGLGRGFLRGGLLGAATEGIRSGFAPNADERISRDEQKGKVVSRIGRVNTQRKLEDEHEQSAAQTEWLRQRPDIEKGKAERKRQYDEWRMRLGDRKQDSAETYREFMMQIGDRRAQTAEGRLELEREWKTIIQPGQFDRTFDQRESHFTRRQQQQQRQFDQTFGLNVDKYLETVRHNVTGEAKDTFDIATKDRIPRLKAIHTEIERWQKRKADGSTRAGEADDYISELQQEAIGLASQIEAVRDAVMSGRAAPALPAPNNATPVRPNARRGTAAVRAPAPTVPPIDEQALRKKAVEGGLDPDKAVERARLRGRLKKNKQGG